ncbi:ATP-binding protein [Streptantibioticus ferralitis]|uniref:ATP-binding protein n=1 Tax=Streptantibioticus ferralitis TaxID=236510 RepID=A0ABT5Z811_9ACTN|nr:ATP-binding protein [Streptantibioticus ferralitis]MDF2259681.1 ATP-binding protein [Streptantibioticus ferralitis]
MPSTRTAHAGEPYPIPADLASRAIARRICRGRRRVFDLDGSSLATPKRARVVVRTVLNDWQVTTATADDIVTIASELTTNTVTHAPSPRIAVVVSHQRYAVTIAVIGPAAPQTLRAVVPGAEAECGRGLAVVAGCADGWGYRAYGTQRALVWARVNLPRSATQGSNGRSRRRPADGPGGGAA